MSTDLEILIATQLRLQTERMKDGDPRLLAKNDPEEWANFMRWNAFALTDEIHEAMAECGWKPWATSRHLDREKFFKEMVDAFHFFMNLLLGASMGMDPSQIAREFCKFYYEKNKVNAQRQVEGYDGVSTKCPECKRELDEVDKDYIIGLGGRIFCSEKCGLNFNR